MLTRVVLLSTLVAAVLIGSTVAQRKAVTCYSCTATGGADCMTGSCQVVGYCTYVKKTTAGVTTVTKGCQQGKALEFDDGSVLFDANVCDNRKTLLSTYTASVCNGASFCNAKCAGQ